MGKITFQVSYSFLLGLLNLPEGTQIFDVSRGSVPGQFLVEANAPGVEGKVEPIYHVLKPSVLLLKEWKHLD